MSVESVQWGPSPGSDLNLLPVTEHHGIVTPEAVLLDVQTAGFASRILAGLLDLGIQLIALFFLTMLLSIAFVGDESGTLTAFAVIFCLFLP